MNTQYVEYPLQDGSTILVEVNGEIPDEVGIERAGRGEIVARASQTLEQALEQIKPATQAVISTLRSLVDLPDEIEVEFGIKLGGKTGVILAAAELEANYKVVLKWKRTQNPSLIPDQSRLGE